MLIQVEHHVIATGKMEPANRREVFAPLDGVVKTLHVTDGQLVRAGDPILRLENADLESQAETLAGKIQTSTQRLSSLAGMRLQESGDVEASGRLAMEQRQLESELANLRTQLTILEAQQAQLTVTSPIDGKVVAWQLDRRLSNRPITRGNLLISVVDPSGPWTLDLDIPDHDAGPVLEASREDGSLPIEFAVATEPEKSFTAELQSIATAARLNAGGMHIIDADATVTGDSVPSNLRSGADVTAKIACGRRSVLRSWFSDVFDFVHRNVLFYF